MTIPDHTQYKKLPTYLAQLSSKQLVFQSHIIFRLKTDAGTENVGHCGTLLGKSVDHRRTGRGKRCLKIVSTGS